MKITGVLVLLIAFINFPNQTFSQSTEHTKRLKNEVREGPGNYYPLLYVLPGGSGLQILERQGGWLKFQLLNQTILKALPDSISQSDSWISKNCLVEKKPRESWRDLKYPWRILKASRAGVSAATRGFALRFGIASSSDLDSLADLQTSFFTPSEYGLFRNVSVSLLQAGSQPQLSQQHGLYFQDYDVALEEEAIGLGIAARIAGRGLIKNPSLKYLNLLSTYLSEETGAYDVPFTVFVSDDDAAKAVSLPGGYIFLTRGILKLCRNEAEIAGVIAHEMMHITLKHGLTEVATRFTGIDFDLMMSELELETEEEADSVSEELEEIALDAYEILLKPRIQSYELEADKGAAILLAKAGYDPMAVPRMILRLGRAIKADENLEMESPFAHLALQKRHDLILEFIANSIPRVDGATNIARFRENFFKD